jgi:hypothetical protein
MEPFSMALVRKVIPELDLIGFAFFVPASLMFLLALQFGSGNTHAWDSATVIGLFVGAGVLAVIFVLWERRVGDRAMIPGSVVGQRVVWASCTFGACNVTCMMVASNWLPTYFQAVKGDGPTMSGVHLLPSILSQVLFVITSGALSMFTPLLSIQLRLTTCSIEAGLLPSLGVWGRSRHSYRQRTDIHFLANHNCSTVDRVPDYNGSRARSRSADSTYLYPVLDTLANFW